VKRDITILVCGGRAFDDYELVERTLVHLSARYTIKLIVHGAARGADTYADKAARCLGIQTKPYPIQPEQWRKGGPKEGPIRNRRMLDENEIDVVVAFPGGDGTANMVEQSELRGIPVRRIGW